MPHFPIATSVLTDAVQRRVFPGAVFGVLHPDEQFVVESIGRFTYEPDSPPIQTDTIFDMASVSKAMATTSVAMLLWERGQLDLDEPLARRVPEFLASNSEFGSLTALRPRVTLRMLLAHCSGLPAYAPLYKTCATGTDLLEACLHMPLEAPPETQAVYSDIGFILLGHLLEQVAGERLDSFCQREIFAPLGMSSSMYCPPADLRPTIPPTADKENMRHRILQGEVHDGNCWRLGGVSGHAGLFSNVPDTLRLADCLLNRGRNIFQPETISQFTTRQQMPPSSGWALGWDTPTAPSSSGTLFSAHSVGHLGYTGTSLWIDFDKQVAIVLLTNRTYPGDDAAASEAIKSVRPRFHDALMRELGWGAIANSSPVARAE
ncbi:MAG TPA: serine hydrolase domain-containing protein [Acidobacteriaceae bacterium]|nr:serine hydrolase domain-containing protein [Acidobacteriaceae bacterium]